MNVKTLIKKHSFPCGLPRKECRLPTGERFIDCLSRLLREGGYIGLECRDGCHCTLGDLAHCDCLDVHKCHAVRLPGSISALPGMRELQRIVHETSSEVGWETRGFAVDIALCHSELSEALEADRKGLQDDKLPHRAGREVELADCVIRIFDMAARHGLDLVNAILEKNLYNKNREDHRPEARPNY